MKNKNIISEQTTDKETKKKFLSLSVTAEMSCFDLYDELTITNNTPQEKNGDIVLLAKGNSGDDWFITYEPTNQTANKGLQVLGQIVKEKDPNTKIPWTCRPLQTEIAKQSQQQKNQPAQTTTTDATGEDEQIGRAHV